LHFNPSVWPPDMTM